MSDHINSETNPIEQKENAKSLPTGTPTKNFWRAADANIVREWLAQISAMLRSMKNGTAVLSLLALTVAGGLSVTGGLTTDSVVLPPGGTITFGDGTVQASAGGGGGGGAYLPLDGGTVAGDLTVLGTTFVDHIDISTQTETGTLLVESNAQVDGDLEVLTGTVRLGPSGLLFRDGTTQTTAGGGGYSSTYEKVYSEQRTLPSTLTNIVSIGSFATTNYVGNVTVRVTAGMAGFAVSKQYELSMAYNESTVWRKVNPVSSTGPYTNSGTLDFDLEALQGSGGMSLRLRRGGTQATYAPTAYITLIYQGPDANPFTASTTTGTASALTTTEVFNPLEAIEVAGTALVNGGAALTALEVKTNESAGQGVALKVTGPDASYAAPGVGLYRGTTYYGGLFAHNGLAPDLADGITLTTATGKKLGFRSGTTPQAFMDSSGRWGLGYAPASTTLTERLEVSGNIKVTGTITSTAASGAQAFAMSNGAKLCLNSEGSCSRTLKYNSATAHTELAQSLQVGTDLLVGTALQFTGTGASKPTCDSTRRGKIWFAQGSAGIADTIEVCRKDEAGTYAWASAAGVEAVRYVGAAGEPAFQNGWTNFGAPFGTAGYYKHEGRVYLTGLVKGGALATIFTLPAGYRPAASHLFPLSDATNPGVRVDVAADGTVTHMSGGNTYIALDSISFRVP